MNDDAAKQHTVVRYALAMRPPSLAERLFGPGARELDTVDAERVGPVLTEYESPDARDVLSRIDVLLTGWGAPALTDDDLAAAPRLRAVLHAGGQAAPILPPSAVDRGIQASNTGLVNARPVAEFTVALIVLANKQALTAQQLYRSRREFIDREATFATAGNAGRTVGVVGASRIGRMVIDRLRGFDLRVLVFDPFADPADIAAQGAELVPLDELLRASDVLTLHPPVTPETVGMIGRAQLAMLRDGATVINTSRGVILDQDALVDELRAGRLTAALDVTEPEVLPADHPLHDLDGVFLTPHMAGSTGFEIARMGSAVLDELRRVVAGDPLLVQERLFGR